VRRSTQQVQGGGGDEEEAGLAAPLLGGGGNGGDGRTAWTPPTLPIIPPPLRPAASDAAAGSARAAWATRISLASNVALLAAKGAAFAASRSRAVQASATDSLVDLASQAILAWAAAAAGRTDAAYPVGKARLATLGVAGSAAVMLVATLGVCGAAVDDLWAGLARGSPPALDVGPALFGVLVGGTALKAGLFFLCRAAARTARPGDGEALSTLAEDHRVDVLANSVAVASSAAVAFGGPAAWPVDPVAALLLSAYILAVWTTIFARTVGKIVGRAAPPEVMAALEGVVEAAAAAAAAGSGQGLAEPTTTAFTVDVLKAWFSGEALLVECEIVMHPATRLAASHDVALGLQHALEAVAVGDVYVERAYVHVDYARREEPEHAPDRAAVARGGGGG